ncbi:hypothetical protein HMPREF0044_0806 [Gleimia coleocanis DSM 15436]|uniref:Glycosyltransferase subfamily 4-like N-terminal domain-containing protein n=1 Tax=Gleimia coleocanis DSM 15436 TaxID=525245 RepID=C0VZS8_9ACTO|nr:glycosyltransferase [Gleimia coleocanis]EEH63787.1 hypothetical protein HMPREF0044_0806 [Gleimia coleocanis DSM 15436]
MLYSDSTRVVHVNEVANVPSTLVTQAQLEGKAWSLQRIPAGKGHPAKVISSRLIHFFQWQQLRHDADIIHLHYATNGYYGWGRKPFVLHLHGSDIRRDWQKPGLRQVITKSIREADAVLCATPDLLPWVRTLRPDAQWIPNPLPLEFFTPADVEVVAGKVVFATRLDETKSIDLLVGLAAFLVQAGIEVHGLDWGSGAARMAEVGVILHPLMPLPEFAKFLGSADFVIGQLQFPALSMTDYQALALGARLLCAASAEHVPAFTVVADGESADFSEGAAQMLPRDPQVLAEFVIGELASGPHSEQKQRAQRDWVFKYHHPANVVAKLEAVYRSL